MAETKGSSFKLRPLAEQSEKEIKSFLFSSHCRSSYSSLEIQLFKSLSMEEEIRKIIRVCKDGFCRAFVEGNTTLGLFAAEKSLWDTNHFGFGVGKILHMTVSNELDYKKSLQIQKILLDAGLSWMKQNEVRCVIARCELEDTLQVISYELEGFQLADVLLTFYLNTATFKQTQNLQTKNSLNVRPSRPEDERALMEIARTAFKDDHFHCDPRFPKSKSDELFAEWISNFLRESPSHVFVAVTKKDKPAGFIACKVEDLDQKLKYGVIDLIAVSPQHQGKGVGTLLTKEAVKWFADDVETVFVGTQARNRASVGTYEKVGFRLFNTELTFHRWLDE